MTGSPGVLNPKPVYTEHAPMHKIPLKCSYQLAAQWLLLQAADLCCDSLYSPVSPALETGVCPMNLILWWIFTSVLCFFTQIQMTTQSHFLLAWRIFPTVSFKEDLLATNCLNFCLSVEVFISPTFLKDSFEGCRILGWQFFPLSSLNVIPLLSLLCSFFWEVSC